MLKTGYAITDPQKQAILKAARRGWYRFAYGVGNVYMRRTTHNRVHDIGITRDGLVFLDGVLKWR